MNTKTVTLTKAQTKALDALLNYVIHAEQKDYDGDPNHIYRAIHALARMRGWDVPSPKALDKEYGLNREAA